MRTSLLSPTRRKFWLKPKVLAVFKTFLVKLERGKQTAFSGGIKLGVLNAPMIPREWSKTLRRTGYLSQRKSCSYFWNKQTNKMFKELVIGRLGILLFWRGKKNRTSMLEDLHIHVKTQPLPTSWRLRNQIWGEERTGCWDIQTAPPPPLRHN